MKRLLLFLGGGLICLFPTSPEAFADTQGTQTTYRPPLGASRLFHDGSILFRGSPMYQSRSFGTIDDPDYRVQFGKYDDPGCDSCRSKNSVQFYGWLEAGVYLNSHGSRVRNYDYPDRRGDLASFHQPLSGNSSVLGKNQSTELQLNQLYFGAKKELRQHGFDWGFKAEAMFGTDAMLAQSFGDASFDYGWQSRDYGLSIPQLYMSLGYDRLSVKIGKFESLLGVEHLQASDSFFYSRSHLFYAEPQSHTGALFEYRANDSLWFNFGYVAGADTTFRNRFDDNGILAGVYWRPIQPLTLWYSFYSADRGAGWYDDGTPHRGGSIYQHTVAANWDVTDRLKYTFQWDYGCLDIDGTNRSNRFYGIANYLTYDITRTLAVGLRADWIHSSGVMEFSGFGRPDTGYFMGDLSSLTLGLNWRPYARLSIRPELRYDHASEPVFDYGRKANQFSAGVGAVYQF